MKSFPMEVRIKDNILMANLMELEDMYGKMDKFMMDNGKMD